MRQREFEHHTLSLGDCMAPHSSQPIESLRHRSEQSRAELKETISQLSQTLSDTTDELKTTLSSHQVKAEVRAYAKRKQTNVIHALTENVTTHPLQGWQLVPS